MPSTTGAEPFDLGSSMFWPARVFASVLATQQQQWQAMLTWQKAMTDLQRDLYDGWTCRFADGARIDD